MRTLLKNGLIVDGSGKAAFTGSVVVDRDRIVEVMENAPESFNGYVMDCEGLVVAAGFIDGHSHHDWFMDRNDPLPYFDRYAEQGITGSIAGNCGFSGPGHPRNFVKRPTSGYKEDGLDFSRMDDWFNYMDKISPANMACLQGHGTIRAGLVGNDPAPLSPENMKEMLRIAEESLEAGACGISLGLMYAPGIFAPMDELMEMARLCKKYDKVLTVHPRAQGIVSTAYPIVEGERPHILKALDEVVEMGRQTGAKVHYSHAMFLGHKTFACNDELMETMMRAHREGVDISFDLYALDCGTSFVTFIMPDWYHALSAEDKKKPENLKKFKDEFEAMEDVNGYGYHSICIGGAGGYVEMEAYTGKRLVDIAKQWGMSNFDTYIKLVDLSHSQARVIMDGFYNDEIIEIQARHPLSQFMTDSWYEPESKQNEHLYSGFTRFLELCREGHGPALEETVHKMSGKIAKRFSLRDRGILQKGAFADIVVFDLNAVKTYPGKRSDGIQHVFINGRHVLKEGTLDRTLFAGAGSSMRVFT